MTRSIVCLAAKRSGTTALHQAFVKHPDVRICHHDQAASNWEPDFWVLAASVLEAQEGTRKNVSVAWEQFLFKLATIAPGLRPVPPLDEDKIFEIWNSVLERYPPTVFDKSPKYLGSTRALDLMRKYRERGNDIRFIALVRDPCDVISSQYELWKGNHPTGVPELRDQAWTRYYENLEGFCEAIGRENCLIVRYEDLSADPAKWFAKIYGHCGLRDVPETYAHIRPVSVGRYKRSKNSLIAAWQPSEQLQHVARRYGYVVGGDAPSASPPPVSAAQGPRRKRVSKNGLPQRLISAALRRLFTLGRRALALSLCGLRRDRMLVLISELTERAALGMPADERLRFLFALENRLYEHESAAALTYGHQHHPKHRLMGYHDFFISRIGNEETVLDIGCGSGSLAFSIAVWSGATVTGIDIVRESIEQAKRLYPHPRLHFVVGDAASPEIRFSCVDTAVLSNVLEHLTNRPDFLRRLQHQTQARRYLIRVPLFERDWRVALKRELGVEWRLDVTHETEYTQESFAQETMAAGLEIVHQEIRWGEIWAELRPVAQAN
jgi:SAM-dependent methyltransferase